MLFSNRPMRRQSGLTDLELLAIAARTAEICDAEGAVTVYGGLYVETKIAPRPVPVFMTGWQEPWMTPPGMKMAVDFTRPEPIKRTKVQSGGWLKWPDRYYHTRNLSLKALYRDHDRGEDLRLQLLFGPRVRADLRESGPYVDVKIVNANRSWFPFKAAYQECGFFLWAGGMLTKDQTHIGWGDWKIFYDTMPVFVLDEVDFSEIGPWEAIHANTEQAREKVKGP